MTFTSYDVKVSGLIWSGYKASTEYHFDHKPTRKEVLDKAGDFQSVTRIQVTERVLTLNTRVGLAKEASHV
ncbi:MAG TPA: hypothetical protein VN861_03020 [Candidatus Acidoferrales bacterium]|nr:hypothetical protein [Candidatus Acidoferrales bacterium]